MCVCVSIYIYTLYIWYILDIVKNSIVHVSQYSDTNITIITTSIVEINKDMLIYLQMAPVQRSCYK